MEKLSATGRPDRPGRGARQVPDGGEGRSGEPDAAPVEPPRRTPGGILVMSFCGAMMTTLEHRELDSRIHQRLVLAIIERGGVPGIDALTRATGASPAETEAALRRLEANHGLVLHPRRPEPWVVHPFSLTPTHFWVETERRGWWAPCAWCAFGVVTLVGGTGRIHTRFGAEHRPVTIDVSGERVTPPDLVVHFPTPVARAWENVHAFCANTLVFPDTAAVVDWCQRHGRPLGDIVSVGRVQRLGQAWYGRHAEAGWRKWTVREAARIFESLELGGDTWRLAEDAGRF